MGMRTGAKGDRPEPGPKTSLPCAHPEEEERRIPGLSVRGVGEGRKPNVNRS